VTPVGAEELGVETENATTEIRRHLDGRPGGGSVNVSLVEGLAEPRGVEVLAKAEEVLLARLALFGAPARVARRPGRRRRRNDVKVAGRREVGKARGSAPRRVADGRQLSVQVGRRLGRVKTPSSPEAAPELAVLHGAARQSTAAPQRGLGEETRALAFGGEGGAEVSRRQHRRGGEGTRHLVGGGGGGGGVRGKTGDGLGDRRRERGGRATLGGLGGFDATSERPVREGGDGLVGSSEKLPAEEDLGNSSPPSRGLDRGEGPGVGVKVKFGDGPAGVGEGSLSAQAVPTPDDGDESE